MSKLFNLKLTDVSELTEGQTYHKDPHTHMSLVNKLEIGTIVGSAVTAKIGSDASFSTFTDAEIHAYINHGGGYHDTP